MGFNQNKCKTQCQLCAGRIRLMRNKRNIQLKNSRKEVANLLRTGKAENARIRVETVMREEAMLQAYDVVELFVELLQVRVAIVDRSKELPPDMTEAISSLIYAAARVTDLQELAAIKTLLAGKFGKEYATEAASDHLCRKWHVNDNLIRWLGIEAPSPEDKVACLAEIAKEHGVDWAPEGLQQGLAGSAAARPYAGGDRTSYSDPLTPPAGGWGGNSGGDAPSYGGGQPGGGQRVTSIYDSEGPFGAPPQPQQQPPPRRDAASGIDYDNDYNAAGRRHSGTEQPPPRAGFTGGFGGGQSSSRLRAQQQGQGQPAPATQQQRQGSGGDESDGVVSYPTAGSAADGVVDYPRPGGGGGGGDSQKGARFDEAAEFAKEQGGAPAGQQQPQQQAPPPQGGPGGSRWAPPPSPGGRGYASHLDAVGKWKARKSGDAAAAAAGPSSSGQPPAEGDAWTRRQNAYDAAPGPPPKPAPPPSAPPAAAATTAAPKKGEEPKGDELDDLQARFAALKQR